jgi:hypothetical protein
MLHATRAKSAKAAARFEKVVAKAAAMAVAGAMAVVLAKMAKDAVPVVKTIRKASSVSQMRTTAQHPLALTRNRRSMATHNRHAVKTGSPVRSAPATVTAVSVDPEVTAANARTAPTCAYQHSPWRLEILPP